MDLYSKVIYEDDAKDLQWRLTVSEFRGIQYLHIRKYFLTFEGDYGPTHEGASFPLTIDSTYRLFTGLYELLSEAEAKELKEKLLAIDKDEEIPF
jgi:hypothetical protein